MTRVVVYVDGWVADELGRRAVAARRSVSSMAAVLLGDALGVGDPGAAFPGRSVAVQVDDVRVAASPTPSADPEIARLRALMDGVGASPRLAGPPPGVSDELGDGYSSEEFVDEP